MFLVNEFLLPLNVLEHVLVFRQHHVVWKHFGILLVELKYPWKSFNSLNMSVESLQVFRKVIENKVILEDRYNVSVLVVHNVADDLRIVVVLRCQVLLIQRLSNKAFKEVTQGVGIL